MDSADGRPAGPGPSCARRRLSMRVTSTSVSRGPPLSVVGQLKDSRRNGELVRCDDLVVRAALLWDVVDDLMAVGATQLFVGWIAYQRTRAGAAPCPNFHCHLPDVLSAVYSMRLSSDDEPPQPLQMPELSSKTRPQLQGPTMVSQAA